MKLFFDARYIRTDFHDGISRYSCELGNALAKITPVTFIICKEDQKKFLPENSSFVFLNDPSSPKEAFAARELNKHQPDVVFSPMQTLGASGRKFKLILTLHDMIYYRHRTPPRNLSLPLRAGWRLFHLSYVPQRLTLNKADMVATVSQTSKQDIMEARLTKRPVVVIPNAPQKLADFLPAPVKTEKIEHLIYMGSFMRYKNVEVLLAGMAFLPGRTLHLLSRITDKRKKQLEALIPKGARVIFHGGVSDKQYAELLAHNAALVSASFDEGYGLPIAEALALGAPVIASDLEIFREVAGEGALFFNPHNPHDFAQKVKMLDDETTRNNLTGQGMRHIHTFSWSKSAKILLEAMQKLNNT